MGNYYVETKNFPSLASSHFEDAEQLQGWVAAFLSFGLGIQRAITINYSRASNDLKTQFYKGC